VCHYPVSDPTGEARKDELPPLEPFKGLYEVSWTAPNKETVDVYLASDVRAFRDAAKAALAENRVLRESMQAIREKLGKPMPQRVWLSVQFEGEVTSVPRWMYVASDIDTRESEVREVCK